jgi:hypothetical protein
MAHGFKGGYGWKRVERIIYEKFCNEFCPLWNEDYTAHRSWLEKINLPRKARKTRTTKDKGEMAQMNPFFAEFNPPPVPPFFKREKWGGNQVGLTVINPYSFPKTQHYRVMGVKSISPTTSNPTLQEQRRAAPHSYYLNWREDCFVNLQ